MKLNTGAVFWAVGLVSAASYAICAVLVAAAPGVTSRFLSWVLHIDLTGLSREVTWAKFFGGMLGFSLVTAILAWASAWAYNRLSVVPGSPHGALNE